MSVYSAANSALLAGIATSTATAVLSAVHGVPAFLAASTDPTASSWDALIPQAGIFAVVIVFFKFMLGRQDTRDEKSDAKDHDEHDYMRSEIERLHKLLDDERAEHNATRKLLVEYLLPTKES